MIATLLLLVGVAASFAADTVTLEGNTLVHPSPVVFTTGGAELAPSSSTAIDA